jgi:hypothetical protein
MFFCHVPNYICTTKNFLCDKNFLKANALKGSEDSKSATNVTGVFF